MSRKQAIIAFLFLLIVPTAGWVIAQGFPALYTVNGSVDRGVTMAEVKAQKGAPASEIGPVGEPPILKWVYSDGEVVVFENGRVLDSFVRRE